MREDKVNLHVVEFLKPVVQDPFLEAAKMLNEAAQNDVDIRETVRFIMDWGAPIGVSSLGNYRKIRRTGVKSFWLEESEGIVDNVLGAGYLLADSALRTPGGLQKFAEALKDGAARRQRVEQMINTLEPDFVGVLLEETERLATDDIDFAMRLAHSSEYLSSLQSRISQFRALTVPDVITAVTERQPHSTRVDASGKIIASDPTDPVTICEINATTTTAQDAACITIVVVVVIVEVLIKIL